MPLGGAKLSWVQTPSELAAPSREPCHDTRVLSSLIFGICLAEVRLL